MRNLRKKLVFIGLACGLAGISAGQNPMTLENAQLSAALIAHSLCQSPTPNQIKQFANGITGTCLSHNHQIMCGALIKTAAGYQVASVICGNGSINILQSTAALNLEENLLAQKLQQFSNANKAHHCDIRSGFSCR